MHQLFGGRDRLYSNRARQEVPQVIGNIDAGDNVHEYPIRSNIRQPKFGMRREFTRWWGGLSDSIIEAFVTPLSLMAW